MIKGDKEIMPRKVNHSKRPEYVALEIMEVGQPVAPSKIDAHVGVGKYSSKYVSFLKRDGYVINVNKDGRNVVSYTLVSRPEVEPPPAQGRPVRVKKLAKVAKAKSAAQLKTPKANKPLKSINPKMAVKVTPKNPKNDDGFVLPEKKSVKSMKFVEETENFPVTQEMNSFAIDQEFDSSDQFDPRDLA